MVILLNGRFILEDQAVISVFDRGFLYGDGLFETMRVFNQGIFRWKDHMERLEQGARFLRLRLPASPAAMFDWAQELIARNDMPDSVLRLTISRGVGNRGYSPKGADRPSIVMTSHSLPDPAKYDR